MSRERYMLGPGKGAFEGVPAEAGANLGPSYQNPGQGEKNPGPQKTSERPPSGLRPEDWDRIRRESMPPEQ